MSKPFANKPIPPKQKLNITVDVPQIDDEIIGQLGLNPTKLAVAQIFGKAQLRPKLFAPRLDNSGNFQIERNKLRVIKSKQGSEPIDQKVFNDIINEQRRKGNEIRRVIMPRHLKDAQIPVAKGFKVEYF